MTNEQSPVPSADLAVAVHRRAERLDPGPVPWAALQRRHHRGTVRRRSLALAGVAAAAAGILLAATSGVGLLTATSKDVSPAGPWPGDPGLSASSPWGVALLQRASTLGVTSKPTMTLMYAADVDDARVALVRVRGAEESLWWYIGPAGASPELMSSDAGLNPGRAYSVVLPPGGTSPRQATVLVLGPPRAELSVWTNDDVTPDGRAVAPKVPGHEIAGGVYTARLTVPFNHAHVELRGLPDGEWGDFTRRDDVQPPPIRDADWWAAGVAGIRGDASLGPPPTLQIRTVYNQLALPSQVPGGRVLWTMPDGDDRYTAVALRAPSGGWALAGIRTEPREYHDGGGYSEGSTVLAATPRPAGDPARLALAWYLDTTRDPAGRLWPSGDRLALVGPSGTAKVRLMGGAEGAPTVPLPGGAGVVRRIDVGKVEFFDATDHSLGEFEVTAPHQPDSRLPTPG
jgi:hypothetical protein